MAEPSSDSLVIVKVYSNLQNVGSIVKAGWVYDLTESVRVYSWSSKSTPVTEVGGSHGSTKVMVTVVVFV